jgi:hypothetical protein
MAGTTPTAQQQQGWSPTQQNPNQPNPGTNPYQAPGISGQGYTQPGYYNASGVDLSQLSPQQTLAYLQQGFAPGDALATNNLNSTLADFGINGGQAVGAMTQLQAQLAGAQAPTLANAIQNSQANLLQGGEFNAGAQNQAGQFNTGAFNNAQSNQLQDLLNLWSNQTNMFGNIIGSGQGAGNQNANQYGSTVTQTQNPFMSIFQGLEGAAGAAAPFLAAGA